ncbi:MAG: Ldh family oxidoreductase, partial [Planctomycetes bacterium]|nr:Ldh family oxidoreductase [Planctomycetota bacterium]
AEDAALLADTLVVADLRGVHSHGVMRVPDYVHKLRVGGVDPAASRPVDVLVFNDDERFHTYSELTLDDRMESVLGYFHPLYWQIHIFEDAKVEETYRVLYHEGFHYYGRLVFRTLPIWLNEGLAEYVGGTLIEKGVVKQRGLVHHGRLNDLVDAMGAGWEPVPFEKLAVMSRPEFYAEDAPFKYAQAWSVVHFLMEGGDAGLKSAFTKYIGLLREGKRAEEAYAQSFADAAAPSQWESRWRAYVKAMKEKRDDPAPRRR